MRRLGTLLTASLVAPRRRPGHHPRLRGRLAGGCRSRPRSPSRGTATGTAAGCRSTAPRARPATGWAGARSPSSTTPGPSAAGAGGQIRVHVSADTTDDLVVVPRSGLTVTDLATDEKATAPRPRHHPLAGRPRRRRPSRAVARRCPVADVAHARGQRLVRGGRRAGPAGHPERLPVLPRPAHGRPALRRPGHGQHGAAGVLPPWRRPARDAGAVVAGRRPRAVGRGPHLRRRTNGRTRARPPSTSTTPPPARSTAVSAPSTPPPTPRSAPPAVRCSTPTAPPRSRSSAPATAAGACRARWPTSRRSRTRTTTGRATRCTTGRSRSWDSTFESKWPSLGNLRRITVVRRDGNGDWGGRVASLRLVGSRNTVTVSGDTMRSVLGLRSTWVTFRVG